MDLTLFIISYNALKIWAILYGSYGMAMKTLNVKTVLRQGDALHLYSFGITRSNTYIWKYQ